MTNLGDQLLWNGDFNLRLVDRIQGDDGLAAAHVLVDLDPHLGDGPVERCCQTGISELLFA